MSKENKPQQGDIRVKRYGEQYHVECYSKPRWFFAGSWETVDGGCFNGETAAISRAKTLVAIKNLPQEDVVWEEDK